MNLVNQTPIPTTLRHHVDLSQQRCRALITAQATFLVSDDGQLRVDRQAPLALSDLEEPYGDHWILPASHDHEPPQGFDVMLIGTVRCLEPRGSVVVTMRVGDDTRRIVAYGDRTWLETEQGWQLSDPVPFTELPLSWSRAFGGHVNVEIDPGAWLPTFDDLNPLGRGFTPRRDIVALGELLPSEESYPKLPEPGLAPNLLAEGETLTDPFERAMPQCWAPLPRTLGVRHRAPDGTLVEKDGVVSLRWSNRWAHPTWRLPQAPPAGAEVEVQAGDAELSFALPTLAPSVDYRVESRSGNLALAPTRMLVLLDEPRVTITYHVGVEIPTADFDAAEFRFCEEAER